MARRGINIHKRKDGRWEARYCKSRRSDGSIVYGYLYGKTYTETREKLLHAIESAPSAAGLPSAQQRRVEDLLRLWMEHNWIRQKGGTTLKYRFIIENHLIPDLGTIRLADIDATTVNAYLLDKLRRGRLDHGGGLSSSYVRTMSIILNSALEFASEEGLRPPLKSRIFKPSVTKQEVPVFDASERGRIESYLLTHLDPTAVGILLSLHLGLRIGEVCALSWEDVDLEQRVIHIRHTVSRISGPSDGARKSVLTLDTPKTKASARDLPITSYMMRVMTDAKERRCSPFVASDADAFVSPRTLEYRYHKVLTACGATQLNYHACRHTFATRCIETGIDVKTLSEMLGHASVSITLDTYVHSSMQRKRIQLEKLCALQEDNRESIQ